MKRVVSLSFLLSVVLLGAGCISYAADESLTDLLDKNSTPDFFSPASFYQSMNMQVGTGPVPPGAVLIGIPTMPVAPVMVPTTPVQPVVVPTAPVVVTSINPSIPPTTISLDQQTCQALRQVIKVGTKNGAVTAIQDVLRQEGYFTQGSTGLYGSITQQSVRAFQAEHGIRTTGLVGELTYQKLSETCVKRLLSQNQPSTPTNTAGIPGAAAQIVPTPPQQPIVPPVQVQQTTQPAAPTTQTTSPSNTSATFMTPGNAELIEAETYGINRSRAAAPASTCTTDVLTGDIDPVAGDGDVDIWDLLQITRNYNKSVNLSTNPRADIVTDGIVDYKDLVIVIQQFSRKACN